MLIQWKPFHRVTPPAAKLTTHRNPPSPEILLSMCIMQHVTQDLTNRCLTLNQPPASVSATLPTEIPLPESCPGSPFTPLPSPFLKSNPPSPTTSETPPMPITPRSQSSLSSPPPLVSISDSSDSEESDDFPISSNMSSQTTTLLKRNSTATYVGEQGKPPVITLGKLTPDLLFDFENGVYSYFSFKDIKPEREVSKVAGGLQDGCIQMWYCLNRVVVDAAGFPTFMAQVHSSWLEPGWEHTISLKLVSSS
ncbi:hypothetical protein PILCRDRAFT_15373 [Piloderma croceum F 1598]|uniref:Uncharacterized protein n=1 Tax=Piloderma croceum (strain F 1598) TaxID=765440 RepID=A0A0C3EZY6_PILCF|nr:hypothetical protein PILCRDRAFT_15373 [Piloderma croceum F 1598]